MLLRRHEEMMLDESGEHWVGAGLKRKYTRCRGNAERIEGVLGTTTRISGGKCNCLGIFNRPFKYIPGFLPTDPRKQACHNHRV